jgi:hypothetical protein
MTAIFAQAIKATNVTSGIVYTWVDAPLAVALLFGLAGSFFIAILVLRRRK